MTEEEINSFYAAVTALGLRQATTATWIWLDGSALSVMMREDLRPLTAEQGEAHFQRIRQRVESLKEK